MFGTFIKEYNNSIEFSYFYDKEDINRKRKETKIELRKKKKR